MSLEKLTLYAAGTETAPVQSEIVSGATFLWSRIGSIVLQGDDQPARYAHPDFHEYNDTERIYTVELETCRSIRALDLFMNQVKNGGLTDFKTTYDVFDYIETGGRGLHPRFRPKTACDPLAAMETGQPYTLFNIQQQPFLLGYSTSGAEGFLTCIDPEFGLIILDTASLQDSGLVSHQVKTLFPDPSLS